MCAIPNSIQHIHRNDIEGNCNCKGVTIGGINLTNLRYADDTVLLPESEEELQSISHQWTHQCNLPSTDINVCVIP